VWGRGIEIVDSDHGLVVTVVSVVDEMILVGVIGEGEIGLREREEEEEY